MQKEAYDQNQMKEFKILLVVGLETDDVFRGQHHLHRDATQDKFSYRSVKSLFSPSSAKFYFVLSPDGGVAPPKHIGFLYITFLIKMILDFSIGIGLMFLSIVLWFEQ